MIWQLINILQRRSRNSRKQPGLQQFHLDTQLLAGLLILASLSLVILYSSGGQDMAIVIRQITRFALGFFVMAIIAQIPPQQFKLWSPWLYILGLILLAAVLIAGDISKGAERWLDFGLFRFQPSEVMKMAVPMILAWYLANKALPPRKRNIFLCLIILIVPTLLIAKQPDLGTAFLVVASGLFVLFFSGIKWLHISLAGVTVGALTPILWYFMREYQKQRVLTLLDPGQDPLGSGYHIIQSQIAIGSGGIFGKGWLNGTQSRLDFLPERSTDFVFAVISEEFGLVGVVLLLSLYFFIITRCVYIATQAQDTFSRLLAGSLTFSFLVYIVVNIGMVTGLLPVVGVPLPLISYGGTSMVTIMASFGVLMSIHTHRRLVTS